MAVPGESPNERAAIVNRASTHLEEMADHFEGLMPELRACRAEIVAAGPRAVGHSDSFASHDELEAAALEQFGFNRLDRARRRLLLALSEPFDDFLAADTPDAETDG